jgi:hypothetical protein
MRRLALLIALAACSSSRDGAATSEAAIAEGFELTPAFGLPMSAGPSIRAQQEPAIAQGHGQYLAAWIEDMTLRATRLDPSGTPLDDRSLRLDQDDGYDEAPSVASDGRGYLVVWTHWAGSTRVIRCIRVEADGRLGPGTELGASGMDPHVAWNGREFLVVWTDYQSAGATTIRGTRVSAASVQRESFAISAAGSSVLHPAVAAMGSTFAVAWESAGQLYAKRLEVDVEPVALGTGADPAIASTDAGFAIAYRTDRAVELATIGGETIVVGGLPSRPALARDGDALVVAWDHHTRRIESGVVTTLPLATFGMWSGRPAMAGEMILRLGEGPTDKYGYAPPTVVNPKGRPISRDDALQRNPVAAFDGRRFLVVWEELRQDFAHPEIWATFIERGAAGVPFTFGPGHAPSVVWDGMNYVAAWQIDGAHAATANVDFEGAFEVGTPFEAAEARVVTGGGNNLLLLDGRRITPAADPTTVLYTNTAPLTVVWDGTSFVVAWTSGTTLYANHFSSKWAPARSSPLVLGDVGPPAPLAAAGNDHGAAMIAWESAGGIFGQEIAGDTATLVRLADAGHAPALAFDGTQWMTVYRTNEESQLTRFDAQGHSGALTLGSGDAHLVAGANSTLFMLDPSSRIALRELRPATTTPPEPTPPAPPHETDRTGTPAYDAPAKRPEPRTFEPPAAPPAAPHGEDGCAMQRGTMPSPGFGALALLLVGSGLVRRRTRVPHARR